MSYVGDMRLATGMQLARRLWSASVPSDTNARAARRTLGRLELLRVLDRLRQRIGGVRAGSASIVYGLGPAGRRILARSGGISPRLGTPGDRYVAHTLSTTELAVRLHEATLRGELDLIELQTESACWRRFPGRFGASVVLKPDLSLRIGVGAFEDRWFVEVDRATESTTTIQAKAERYLEHYRSGSEQRTSGVYPRVLWTVPDSKRGEQIRSALARLPEAARRLFVVWVFEEVIGRLVVEAEE